MRLAKVLAGPLAPEAWRHVPNVILCLATADVRSTVVVMVSEAGLPSTAGPQPNDLCHAISHVYLPKAINDIH